MSQELNHCPFCGSHELCPRDQDGISWVECCDCNAEGPTTEFLDDAIDAWNSRATPPGYALVPIELKEAMIEAAEEAYMPF